MMRVTKYSLGCFNSYYVPLDFTADWEMKL